MLLLLLLLFRSIRSCVPSLPHKNIIITSSFVSLRQRGGKLTRGGSTAMCEITLQAFRARTDAADGTETDLIDRVDTLLTGGRISHVCWCRRFVFGDVVIVSSFRRRTHRDRRLHIPFIASNTCTMIIVPVWRNTDSYRSFRF